MTQIQNLIGEKSVGAFKKEQQRMLKKEQEDKCPPLCPPEIEIELEQEIEIEQEQQLGSCEDEVVDEQVESCEDGFADEQPDSCVDEVVDFYEKNIALITPYILELLASYEEEMSKEVVIYAMKLAVEHNVRTPKYIKRNIKQLEQKRRKNTHTGTRGKQKIPRGKNE